MADLGGRALGEFILRERIGEGGYAAVYRGEQPALKRDVVIKVLHERRRRNDAAQERFLREAHLASRLDHPYAAHIYASGAEDDGLLWIAMELVQGITLARWLHERGPMPLDQFVPLFECIAEVVQAAHDHGIVHRDLKPSNVMVLQRGARLLPKLLDFGIAKLNKTSVHPEREPVRVSHGGAVTTARMRISSPREQRTLTSTSNAELTRSGLGMGSAPYMSPEQWSDAGSVGPASDIYSLGIVTYEVLTGHTPFTASNSPEYHRLHIQAEIAPLGAGFSPELDSVMRRALAKCPDARHTSVQELASDLRAALRTQPHEQVRSLAQVWHDRARSPALLLKNRELLRAQGGVVGELERTFVAASRQHAARAARIRGIAAAAGAALVLAAVWYRGEMRTDLADERAYAVQQLAEMTVASARRMAEVALAHAERERAREALLHDEPEALPSLAKVHRDDRTPATAFMFARAIQPVLAERKQLVSSSGRMWSAMFSPDGKQIITTDDEKAQVWDALTYELVFTLRHGDVVHHAIHGLDGTRLITAGGDGTVRIWDLRDGSLVRRLGAAGIKPRYARVAISPDGRLVAAMDLSMAHVWDASTGALLAELHDEASTGSPSLAFSSDGRWLATGSGNDVHVFETRTWQRVLTVHGPGIDGLSWDPKGPRLLTGSTDGDVSIWAIPGGRRVHHLREIGEPVDAVAFSPDGRLVAAASRDGAEQIWSAASGKLLSQGNHLRSKIRSIEFDPTSSLVVAAGTSGAVAVADATQGVLVSVLEGPRQVVMTAHFDPSSRLVIGASWDGTARIWEATSPYRAWSSPPIADDCGLVTSLEPDRPVLAIGCEHRLTPVWDTRRGELLAELPSVTPPGGDFTSAFPAVSADGSLAAIARGSTVEVYGLPGGELRQTIEHGSAVTTVAFAAAIATTTGDSSAPASTDQDLVSGAVDGSVFVTTISGRQLRLRTSSRGVDAVGFLHNGWVVAADAERRLWIFDRAGNNVAPPTAHPLELAARARTLRMSPDSLRLITVPRFTDKPAAPQLWDVAGHRLIAALVDPHGHGQVYSARFIAGGEILTACGDGAARKWDGATGKLRQTYPGGSRFLADVALSPDGSLVVGGGGDGLLRFWDAVTGRRLWTMPAHRSHLVGIRIEGNEVVTRGFSGDISRWKLPDTGQVIDACRHHERCAGVFK